ncbi:MAG: T9SS type A sorting domain-containing protein [Bacteroidetes bacterium]|nr:T9SS type A sorting domain-containing protein [Bacteroidota bacterium]
MKNILLVLALIFNTAFLFAQTCGNDSVVIRHFYRIDDQGDQTNTVYTDSFDLSSGTRYSSQLQIINSIPGNPVFTQGTFIRKLISYNALMDTTEYLELQGTGSGFINKNKIEFTYTPDERPLTKVQSIWNGTSWSISKSEVWTYNSSDLILNYLVSDASGNISQNNYFYTGLQQTSIQFQNYSSGSWVNEEQYLITYDAADMRDSLYVQRWDIDLGIWIDSLQAEYDTVKYAAKFMLSLNPGDTGYYYIDSLNNIISHDYESYSNGSSRSQTWDYFNNHLKITRDNYRIDYHDFRSYQYNAYGFLTGESNNSGSSISSGSSGTTYDDFSNPVSSGGSYSSMAGGSSSTNTNYYYASSDQISLSYIPGENLLRTLCQGDSVLAYALVAGGCGPYTYLWSPSTGLSSDTIANPMVSTDNQIQYSITVVDSIGNTASSFFNIQPYEILSVQFDSTLCSGCPVVLRATSGYANYQWYKNDTLIYNENQETYTATESGIYTVRVNSYCDMVSEPIVLTLTGLTRIQGYVYLDMDSDCVYNNFDRNLSAQGTSPILINLERDFYSALINVDSSGSYDIPVDTGTYRISIYNTSNAFTFSCPDSGVIHVNVPAFGDTISGNNFAFKKRYNCEKLSVSVTSTRFRPCMNSQITVNYYNEGSEDANNPIVNLRLPEELINISSAQPYTLLPNNTYQFSLPLLPINSYRSISITADVICDPTTLQNATLCIDADISPTNFCSFEPDSLWDGSYIRIIPTCENDSSCFKIYNIADAGSDMDAPSQWRLFADNLAVQQGTFQLLSGDDTTLCFISDGKTLRLEADQSDNFPTTSHPNAKIERCGILQSGQNYSYNYILQTAADNSVPFHNSYCAHTVNSYDPNEKSVRPIGIGTDHKVDPEDRFYFRIDFQNSGTDTAYKVRIIDNLSYLIDPTTIQVTASSHPANFSIQNSQLTWLFDPILLPDSNVDEANSHGYVEFNVKLISGIAQGTLLRNNAQIFFDGNDPIYTNMTQCKLCKPEIPSVNIFPISDFCSDTISIGRTISFPGTSPYLYWYVNGSLYFGAGDTLTLPFTDSIYTIQSTLISNYVCAIINNVSSNIISASQTRPSISYSWPELIATSGLSYQWYLDSLPISGATSQSYIPLSNGNYNVSVTDTAGCMFTSPDFPFVFTGISGNNSEYLKVYPNPSTGQFKIETVAGNKSISVVDITGRSLLQFNTKEKIFTIDLSDKYSTGIYYMIVRTGENIYYERIVLQQ